MAGLNHQSFKDDCLSLDSSSEELKTLSNNDNTLRFDLIEMDISVSFIQFSTCILNVNST